MKFSFNSRFMDYLNTATQFVLLNIIFLLCCLPVITIGPAVAALYQIILREVRGEHGYLVRKYFVHFKEMFSQAFFTFLLLMIVSLLLLFNLVFWNAMEGLFAGVVVVIMVILLFITTCVAIYVFPLMARFQNSFLKTLKNAFLIAATNPRTTLILVLIHALTVAVVRFFPSGKVFLLLIGFSFVAYCNSYLLNKVFRKYE